MHVTENIAKFLRDKGIKLSVLSKRTGIPYPVLYASLGLQSNGKRELRADELISICTFLGLNPMEFADFPVTASIVES